VTFRGYVDQDDLPAFYRELDVVAVPSIPVAGWDEQFCRVAVEAMASGVPVVASRTGALPEVIGSGGLLVPPDDFDALAAALHRLGDEPGLWGSLRSAALDRSARFSWSQVAASQTDFYHRVIERDRRTRRNRTRRSPLTVVVGTGTRPDPYVVVVAYGPPDALARTLAALGAGMEVVVVDNSISDETRQVVEQAGATYVDPGGNIGFAAGVNLGLKDVPAGRDVLLLNPDAVIDRTSVEDLSRALAVDPDIAAVAPALRNPRTGAPERVAWPFPSPAQAWREAFHLERSSSGDGFLIGAVLLLRGEAIEDVGKLDERFFLYAEETDWQFRARSAGWRLTFLPEVTATHEGAGTGGDPGWREATFTASGEAFILKWYGHRGLMSYRAAKVAREVVRSVVRTGDGRREALRRLRRTRQRSSEDSEA